MRGVRIPDDLNSEDRFLLGLSVPNLAVLLFGLLAAYTVLHLHWSFLVRLPLAAFLSGAAAAQAWVRPAGRSLTHWLGAALEYQFARYPEHAAVERSQESHSATRRPQLTIVPPSELGGESRSDANGRESILELPVMDPSRSRTEGYAAEQLAGEPTPVYLGSPQVVSFFSIKGGTGRTTLATEMACLLASRGWYKDSPRGRAQRLKVALMDFDIGSANVSVRIGLAQPTILDYLAEATTDAALLAKYLLCHEQSGLHVLLGTPKCMTHNAGLALRVPQAAEILAALKADGYHFIFVDLGAALNDLDTFLLQAADRIFYIVTPTAGSIQDLYRGVEALRRLGLGPKLRYVANKMRERWDLSEPMGDLGGSIAARIPFDTSLETAENRHQPYVLKGKGETQQALMELGCAIYPALDVPESVRPGLSGLRWFARPRHAG